EIQGRPGSRWGVRGNGEETAEEPPVSRMSDETGYFRLADITRIKLSETLSGDPIGNGRSSLDRLFFCYPLERLLSRTSCQRMAIRGSCHAVPSLSMGAVREAPRRYSWRIDRLCRISARGTPKVGTSTSGYKRSGDAATAEPFDGAACS